MSIYIKDEATSKAVRKLAKLRGTNLTEAVRFAVEEAILRAPDDAEEVALRKLQIKFASRPETGKTADKAC
jgi:hypothetical protein